MKHNYTRNYFKIIVKYIKEQKIEFCLLIISSLFWSIQQFIIPVIIKYIINLGIYSESKELIPISIDSTIIALVLLYAFAEFVTRMQGVIIAIFMPKFKNKLKSYYLNYLVNRENEGFLQYASGYVTDKINTVATATERILQIFIYNFFALFCSLFFVSFLLFFVEPIYSVILVIWFFMHFCMTVVGFKRVLPYVERYSNHNSLLTAMMTELFDRGSLIRLFGAQKFEINRVQSYLNEEAKLLSTSSIYFEKNKILQGILTITLLVGLIWHMLHNLSAGKINYGNFAFVIFSVFNTINYTWFSAFQLTMVFKEYGSLMSSLRALKHHELKNEKQDIKLVDEEITIKIENLQITNINANMVNRIDFHISSYSNTIIHGRSGIGKSTLAKILVGLHTKYSGTVYINGINIKQYSMNDIRKVIILVEQQNKLFTGTIYENIIYNSKDPGPQELQKILEITYCDEIINSFSEGLNTRIFGTGENLSGGQIQRICIARALLANPKILILDESTTGLEQNMAKQLINNLFNIKELTTIIITHNIHLEHKNYNLINLEYFLKPEKHQNKVKEIA